MMHGLAKVLALTSILFRQGFRAIENGIMTLRSANTGISAAIDPLGEFYGQIPLSEKGYSDHNVYTFR